MPRVSSCLATRATTLVAALVPWTWRAWKRWGFGSFWAFVAGAVAIDVASLRFDVPYVNFLNFAFVWLAHQPLSEGLLYIATGADQFGNGLAGTVFVVYLSMLVNPRYPGAQYAFLSGFAFLLPRLLAGASGSIQERIGYDGFFMLAGVLSLVAVAFLPLIARLQPRASDEAA